ncbi:DHS-like NAD/FAD-binding domain-containing protein, partial [Haematococcus lacustris]
MELRKRSRGERTARQGHTPLHTFLDLVEGCQHVVVFTGAGISANSGMSTFTSRNGLYDRAREQFNVQDGMKLFTYSFFKQHRAKVQPSLLHSDGQGVGKLSASLSVRVGLSTWHPQANPAGSTVELHGNIRPWSLASSTAWLGLSLAWPGKAAQPAWPLTCTAVIARARIARQLVCPSCLSTSPLTRRAINAMKDEKVVCCPSCAAEGLRFKVMLYDDDQGACITPEHVFETLEEDLQVADCVLWVGISFEQAASVEYFRQVRQLLASLGRLTACPQVVINPSAAACANVVSSMCNLGGLQLLDVRATADTALPALAERMASRPHPTPATHLTTTTSTHPSAVSSLPSTSSPTLSAATGSPAAAPAQATTATAGRQPQPKGRPAGEAGLLQPESSNPGGPATRPALQTSSYTTSRAEALQQQQQQQQQGQ